MKPKMPTYLFLALGIVSLLGGSAWSGPLRSSDVPGEPAWVAHLDCDALRTNALGKFMLAEMNKPENESKIAAVTVIFGVDLRTQIHALTFYAAGGSSHQPLALVYGDFDTNRLVTLAKAAREYDSKEHGDHMIHSWLDDRRKKPDGSHPRIYAALPSNGLIIFGPREEAVGTALDVLDNKAANLSASKTYLQFLKSGDGGFFQAAARKIELPASDPRKVVFDLTTHVRLNVREAGEQLTTALSIGARDEEVAKSMLSIAQGITGLAKAQQEKPKVAKLAERVVMKQDGTELVVTFGAPSDEVIGLLKFVIARKFGAH